MICPLTSCFTELIMFRLHIYSEVLLIIIIGFVENVSQISIVIMSKNGWAVIHTDTYTSSTQSLLLSWEELNTHMYICVCVIHIYIYIYLSNWVIVLKTIFQQLNIYICIKYILAAYAHEPIDRVGLTYFTFPVNLLHLLNLVNW